MEKLGVGLYHTDFCAPAKHRITTSWSIFMLIQHGARGGSASRGVNEKQNFSYGTRALCENARPVSLIIYF